MRRVGLAAEQVGVVAGAGRLQPVQPALDRRAALPAQGFLTLSAMPASSCIDSAV